MQPDSFRLALLDPFNEDANGARVPDLFSAPTEARTFKQSFTLTSDAAGALDFTAFANPTYTGVSLRSNITGGSTFVLSSNSSSTVANAVPAGAGSSLPSEFASYRVVGWGMKITSIAALTSSSGTVVAATLPYAGYVPHQGNIGGQSHTAGNVGSIDDWLNGSGIPYSSSKPDVTKLESVGESTRVAAQSLAAAPLVLVSRPVDPRAYNLRYSADSYFGYDMVGQTSTTYVVAGNGSYLDASGWLSFVIGGTGFPATTNVLEVELVYHLEGVPAMSSSILNRGSAGESPVNWQGYIDALTNAARQPAIKTLVKGVISTVGSPALAALVG